MFVISSFHCNFVHLPQILQAKKQVIIKVVGENLFLLDFCSDSDRNHALFDGPWSFFKDLIVFKAPIGLQKPTDMSFDTIPIWVQYHNVPLTFMHSSIIRSFGRGLVMLLRFMQEKGGRCDGKFARIQIKLNITKPLRQRIWVQPEMESDEICILLLYERIPNFCYGCGRIGHVVRDCNAKGSAEAEQPFGNWIRASLLSAVRKVSATRGVSPQRSDSPSFPSREREVDIIELGVLAKYCKDIVGTCSSRDKNETDDNVMCVAETQNILIPQSVSINLVKQMDLVRESTKHQPTDLIEVIQADNKKWKRLARGKSVTPVEYTKNSPIMFDSKRSMTEHAILSANPKRARVENLSESEVVTHATVAAGSPFNNNELCYLECVGVGTFDVCNLDFDVNKTCYCMSNIFTHV